MRKTARTEKFSPDASWLWYVTALAGLLLFCFAVPPTAPQTAGSSSAAELRTTPDTQDAAVFLMQGDRGEEVERLQNHLRALGYDVGDSTGVYTVKTASAVRRFQLDCGMTGDGICTSAVSDAAAYLAEDSLTAVSEDALWAALASADCIGEYGENASSEDTVPEDAPPEDTSSRAGRLRNALILFQRTHGLCGTGEPDFATLCALGVADGARLTAGSAGFTDAVGSAVSDLRCRLLCGALAEFVSRYPEAYDLYTLTACAAVLCARTEDARFPGGFDAVCRRGLLPDNRRVETSSAQAGLNSDPLLLLAAEDALTAFYDGDRSGGALYVSPTEEIPEDVTVCFCTRDFVFYR